MLLDPFTAYMIGSAVQEMKEDTKRDITTLLEEGETSTRLLVEVLPLLRAPEARRLRTRILTHLDTSKVAAIVRKHGGAPT